MRYLITGVKGQLGYDIVKELTSRGYSDVIGLDADEMDITDPLRVNKVIDSIKPDVIFHCAAYTAVDKAEDNKELCTKVNVDGTKNITNAAIKNNSKLFYISSDYTFDGTKDGIYEENDKPNPLSVYGLTKYLGELEAQKNPKTFVLRISWVFGVNGNNFVKTMLRLAETKQELNIVDDQIGSPTYTVDLAKLLVDMAQTNKYGTYHATNTGFCSWAYFAKTIFETNNIDMKINPIKADQYPSLAVRPKNSKMSKNKLIEAGFNPLPTWQDALDRYNEELKELTQRRTL